MSVLDFFFDWLDKVTKKDLDETFFSTLTCPKCGSHDVTITVHALIRFNNGKKKVLMQPEINNESCCYCNDCQYERTVKDFLGDSK